jgi:hypothetical protein
MFSSEVRLPGEKETLRGRSYFQPTDNGE